MAHVAKYKEAKVDKVAESIKGKPVIAVVNVDGIPGPQLAKMRRLLAGQGVWQRRSVWEGVAEAKFKDNR